MEENWVCQWLDCMYKGNFFGGKIFLDILNDAVQHFFMQWTKQIYCPIWKCGKKICPILFEKMPQKMWENIK